MLICVVYTFIENYACIDYLSFQSKTLCGIHTIQHLKKQGFNLLLVIGIPELLLNLLSCNGFMLESNSTVILKFRSRLINNYLSKGLFIIEQSPKQLNFISNDVILKINLVNQLKTHYVMVKNESLSEKSNTNKQLHNHKNMHMTYKQDFYKTKENEID